MKSCRTDMGLPRDLVRLYPCLCVFCELKELQCQHLIFLQINVVCFDVLLSGCLYGIFDESIIKNAQKYNTKGKFVEYFDRFGAVGNLFSLFLYGDVSNVRKEA